MDGQIRPHATQGVVVLGQRHPKDAHVSSVQLAAAGDGGGRYVVADHSVHVARRLHGGETGFEEAIIRAAASHLGVGAQRLSWGRCSWSYGGGVVRARSTE